jgi:hypothetical protein
MFQKLGLIFYNQMIVTMKHIILFLNFFGIRVFTNLLQFRICKESSNQTLYFVGLKDGCARFSSDSEKAVVYSTLSDAKDVKKDLIYWDRLFIQSSLKPV